MNDLETLLAVLVLIWILWPFLIAAVIVMIRASLDLLDHLTHEDDP